MKLRLATVWLGGCSGCHMSFLDLDEFLVDLAQQVEIVFSPIVDVKEYPHNVDLCLIEGAVCNEDHVEMLHQIRERTKTVVSFGDCAVTGNVTAIRNQLAQHAETVRSSVARKTLALGVQHYTRPDLEALRTAGHRIQINVLGLASIAEDVSPDLALATIESITVLGALRASPSVRAALRGRILSP